MASYMCDNPNQYDLYCSRLSLLTELDVRLHFVQGMSDTHFEGFRCLRSPTLAATSSCRLTSRLFSHIRRTIRNVDIRHVAASVFTIDRELCQYMSNARVLRGIVTNESFASRSSNLDGRTQYMSASVFLRRCAMKVYADIPDCQLDLLHLTFDDTEFGSARSLAISEQLFDVTDMTHGGREAQYDGFLDFLVTPPIKMAPPATWDVHVTDSDVTARNLVGDMYDEPNDENDQMTSLSSSLSSSSSSRWDLRAIDPLVTQR